MESLDRLETFYKQQLNGLLESGDYDPRQMKRTVVFIK